MAIRSRQLSLGLFVLFLGFYLATASGHSVTIDGEYYFRAAESLVLRGSFAVEMVHPRDEGQFALRAPNGLIYGKFAPLQSLAEAPFYLLLRSLATLEQLEGAGPASFLRVWVPVATTATIGAAIVALVSIAVRSLGYRRDVALAIALILGLCTLAWPYGRSEFSEPLQALLLLGAFLQLRRVGEPGSRLASLLAGLLLGLLVLAKAINLLVLPIFGLAILWRLRSRPRRVAAVQVLAFVVAALAGIGAFMLLNQARTGSPFDFGYDEPFDTPILLGLYGWTISPGKGVFLYMPVLLAAAVGLLSFARRHRLEAAVIVATSAILIAFYARFWAWSGDWAWGLRFAVPLLPLWVLPLATGLTEWRTIGRVLLAVAASLSLVVQILGVAVDPMKYLMYYHNHASELVGEPAGYTWEKESRTQVHFAPELSPLVGHWRMLKATVSRDPTLVSTQPPTDFVEPPPIVRMVGIQRWLPPPTRETLGLDLWIARPHGQEGRLALVALGCLVAVGLLLVARGTATPPPNLT